MESRLNLEQRNIRPFPSTNSTREAFIRKFSYYIFINNLKYFEAFFNLIFWGLKPLFWPRGPWVGPECWRVKFWSKLKAAMSSAESFDEVFGRFGSILMSHNWLMFEIVTWGIWEKEINSIALERQIWTRGSSSFSSNNFS